MLEQPKILKMEMTVIEMGQVQFLLKNIMLQFFEEFDDLSDVFKREKQLKNWHKDWKWNVAKLLNPELNIYI